MTRPQRRRLILARLALGVLVLPLLLTWPRIFPCPAGEEDCPDCEDRGFVSGVTALKIRMGLRKKIGTHNCFYYSSTGLDPEAETFTRHAAREFIRHQGDLRIFWPHPPVLTIYTPALVLTVHASLALLAIGFLPCFACPDCPGSACPRCEGTGTRSAWRRWVREPWRLRIWKTLKILLLHAAVLLVLFLGFHVELLTCPDCRSEERGPVPSCWRCGNARRISVWNSLFAGG